MFPYFCTVSAGSCKKEHQSQSTREKERKGQALCVLPRLASNVLSFEVYLVLHDSLHVFSPGLHDDDAFLVIWNPRFQ
eukprot:scaffold31625_cov65-Cyclotella_meneghiniana.AAC.1